MVPAMPPLHYVKTKKSALDTNYASKRRKKTVLAFPFMTILGPKLLKPFLHDTKTSTLDDIDMINST